MDKQVNALIKRLEACPKGKAGWKAYEEVCGAILEFLFSPVIRRHKKTTTLTGVSRRDLIFANRNLMPGNTLATANWNHLYGELAAKLVVFECKNYHTDEIGATEVNQVRAYLSKPMGRLAVLICNKKPHESAYKRRNTVYSNDQVVVLFATNDELKEMLYMKLRNEEPSDLLLDLVDQFYIQHE
ncbi:MAG TPA: hypothetical protein VKB19_18355 [Pedobacter sp.]|nr:hypothetical protein [Pedobacter sp.]